MAAVPVADKQYLAKAVELGVDLEQRGQDFRNPSRFYTKGRDYTAPNIEDRLQTFPESRPYESLNPFEKSPQAVEDEKSNSQGMYLIGGICVAGILLYVYK